MTVQDRHDHDPILVFEIGVHDHHPSPGAEHEAEVLPASMELGSEKGETPEWFQGAFHALLGVRLEAVSDDQTVEILGCCRGKLDQCHELELVDGNRLPGVGLLEAQLGTLECAGNAVEQLHDMTSINVGIVDGVSEKRPRKCSFLGTCALGEERELLRAFGIKRDV
jgi:hypothetical protein